MDGEVDSGRPSNGESDAAIADASGPERSQVDSSVVDGSMYRQDGGEQGAAVATDGSVLSNPEFDGYSGPMSLREAGYFSGAGIAPGLEAYEPRFSLWSDGLLKRRYVSIPTAKTIDTRDMDQWVFPIGTKAFKEFLSVDAVSGQEKRLETRMLEKRAGGWFAISFLWNESQTEALPVPWGRQNVLGTDHDVPRQEACLSCHQGNADMLLGVDAFQLSHESGQGAGLSLAELRAEGMLSHDPGVDQLSPPGDSIAVQALGMLHVNCGSCHQPGTFAFERTDLNLRLWVDELNAVEETAAYRTSVRVANQKRFDAWPWRIEPGSPDTSAMLGRMASRESKVAMPPLGSEMPDLEGLQVLSAWIESLSD